ncbi:MAG: thrombospondin type 3 repeat-containing protein [Deltaproteobacteria bacterium]|nr:thrombospondin type 3 repeat-containing protein [Deltaproteobacteria bacterium]
MARSLTLAALPLCIGGCGLDLSRDAGSVALYLLRFPEGAAAVEVRVQHHDHSSRLRYAALPDPVVESVPAGDNTVVASVQGPSPSWSNHLPITVFAGERLEVGLSLTDDPNADPDGDGVGNRDDNCPWVANPGGEDGDRDGIGDACDDCVAHVNPRQDNLDGDSYGDACDADTDGDGVLDVFDQCRRDPTGSIDADVDGACDSHDNCLGIANPNQADCSHNEIGDACDLDIDGDRIPNAVDDCPFAYDPEQLDLNLDGVGDACVKDPTQCVSPPLPP